MNDNINVLTINARGLNNTKKRHTLCHWLNDQQTDIALIQESYCIKSFKSNFGKQWNGKIYHSFSNSKHARGVCILLSEKFNFKLLSCHHDNEGRKILINI